MGISCSTGRKHISDFDMDLEKGDVSCPQCSWMENVCPKCGMCEDCARFEDCELHHNGEGKGFES